MGNFDNKELFVDRSYAPSIQSHQLIMRRAAFQFIREGDKEKAIELIDKYFESFPHMNFPYDYRAYYMISVYLQADAYDKAKPHLEVLANATLDQLEFYDSLDPNDIQAGFETEYALALRTKDDIIQAAQRAGDTEFETTLKEQFAPFDFQQKFTELTFQIFYCNFVDNYSFFC